MCDKAVSKNLFMLKYCHYRYKTQEICDKAVFQDPFMVKNCHDKYKTQEMCHKAVDDFLLALKFVPHWFVTNKIIKNFILLYSQMMIYSFVMKILVMLHFQVMRWVFLV